MNYRHDRRSRQDLGRASRTIKGPTGIPVEFGALQPKMGLSDE